MNRSLRQRQLGDPDLRKKSAPVRAPLSTPLERERERDAIAVGRLAQGLRAPVQCLVLLVSSALVLCWLWTGRGYVGANASMVSALHTVCLTALATFSMDPRALMLLALAACAGRLATGRFFPRGDRTPWLNPMASAKLDTLMLCDTTLRHWPSGRAERIASGVCISQAIAGRRP